MFKIIPKIIQLTFSKSWPEIPATAYELGFYEWFLPNPLIVATEKILRIVSVVFKTESDQNQIHVLVRSSEICHIEV
jgi:hypothetical protein